MDTIQKQLGKRVRDLRLAKGLSQELLANEFGCLQPYSGMLERKSPQVPMLDMAYEDMVESKATGFGRPGTGGS